LPTINSLDHCHHFNWIDTREIKRYHRSASSSTYRLGDGVIAEFGLGGLLKC
jgi:hypothetical protein